MNNIYIYIHTYAQRHKHPHIPVFFFSKKPVTFPYEKQTLQKPELIPSSWIRSISRKWDYFQLLHLSIKRFKCHILPLDASYWNQNMFSMDKLMHTCIYLWNTSMLFLSTSSGQKHGITGRDPSYVNSTDGDTEITLIHSPGLGCSKGFLFS